MTSSHTERDQQILHQYKRGVSRKELGRTFKLSDERISQILRGLGIDGRRSGPRRPVAVTVIVTLEVQAAVRAMAEARKTSVSQMLNGWVEDRLKAEQKIDARNALLPARIG